MSKGLNTDVLKFDHDRNCLVIVDGENETPCVNWYQHEKHAVILDRDTDDQEVKIVKGPLRACYVAAFLSTDPDIIVIGHSIVHPSDRNRATKVRGRTIAANRLLKAVKTTYYNFHRVAYYDGGPENNCHVDFCILDQDLLRVMVLEDRHFLSVIYKRLKKIADG